MKNKKLYLFMIIMLAFIAMPIAMYAQDESKEDNTKQVTHQYKMTPEEQAKKMTDKLSTRLKLTNDQSGSIQKLLSDKISYARELRSKDLISKSEIKAKRKEFRDGINKILTKKQQKKFHKMMKKQFRKHHRHHHKILGLF